MDKNNCVQQYSTHFFKCIIFVKMFYFHFSLIPIIFFHIKRRTTKQTQTNCYKNLRKLTITNQSYFLFVLFRTRKFKCILYVLIECKYSELCVLYDLRYSFKFIIQNERDFLYPYVLRLRLSGDKQEYFSWYL